MRGYPEELFRRKADRTRWRNGYLKAFLVGYAATVAERVAAARGRLRDGDGDSGGPGGALVLARDDERVLAEFAARFPALGKPREQRVRRDGFAAGRDAGRFADLGSGAVDGSRRALGGS
jgi:hypothetical protein